MDNDAQKIFESYNELKGQPSSKSKSPSIKRLSQSPEVRDGVKYTDGERKAFHHDREKKKLRAAGYDIKQEDKELTKMRDDEHNPPDDEYTDDSRKFTPEQQNMIDSDEYWRDLYSDFEGMDEDGLRRELSLVDCPKKAAAIKNLLDMDDWEREFWWGSNIRQEQSEEPVPQLPRESELVYPQVETVEDFIEYYLGDDPERAHFKPEALKAIEQVEYDEADYGNEWPGATLVVIIGMGNERYGDDYVIIMGEQDVGYEVTSTDFKPLDNAKIKELTRAEITWDYDRGATKRGAPPKLKTVNVGREIDQKLQELEAEHYGISTFELSQNYYNYGGPTERLGSWHPSDFR